MEAELVAAVDPDHARESAQHILDDRRFHSDAAPRPLRGPLEWTGHRLSSVGHWFDRAFRWIPWPVRYLLAIAVVGAIVALIVHLVRRRAKRPANERAAGGVTPAAVDDPDALERDADAAERDGDLDRAIRLRFRAGLLRLGRRGAIQYRPSVTTGEVRRALHSETFDGLAGTFERVTYGGRDAVPPDVDAARRDWPRVLDNASRR